MPTNNGNSSRSSSNNGNNFDNLQLQRQRQRKQQGAMLTPACIVSRFKCLALQQQRQQQQQHATCSSISSNCSAVRKQQQQLLITITLSDIRERRGLIARLDSSVCVCVCIREQGPPLLCRCVYLWVLLHCLTQHKQHRTGSQPDSRDSSSGSDVEGLSMAPLISAAHAIFFMPPTQPHTLFPPRHPHLWRFSIRFLLREWRMQMRGVSKSSAQHWEWQVAALKYRI